MENLAVHRIGKAFLGPEGLSLEALPVEFQKWFPDVSPKYIDSISLLTGIAAAKALERAGLEDRDRADFAVVLGSGFGALESLVDFDAQALLKGPNAVNPMDFPNTVANAAGSRVGIWLQLKGPNVTLTNGDTAFLDALGFAWEGSKGGLFKRGLVGAAERVPSFLRTLAQRAFGPVEISEGACLLLAGGPGPSLFHVTDYFSLQLKPDQTPPAAFKERLAGLWRGVEWIGAPGDFPQSLDFPSGMEWWSPPAALELGLGGVGALEAFLEGPCSTGLLAAHSKAERKVSFVKIAKK